MLDYFAQLSGVPAGDRARRVDAMLDRVGLSDSRHVQLRKFSKGMLQRIGIAQAIIHNPKIVFLDEPMSGLDPIGRREVRDLIQSLKDAGKTVFFSTHILSDAEALCDRIAVINNGEVRGVGVVQELLSRFSGTVEVIWDGAAGALSTTGAEIHVSGETARAVIPQSDLDAAIEKIRLARGRLLSVTPVRASLEDFFLEKIGEERSAEVSR